MPGALPAPSSRAVLDAALAVFTSAQEPGHVEHLPFAWHQQPADTQWHPAEPSPIIALVKAHQAKRREESG